MTARRWKRDFSSRETRQRRKSVRPSCWTGFELKIIVFFFRWSYCCSRRVFSVAICTRLVRPFSPGNVYSPGNRYPRRSEYHGRKKRKTSVYIVPDHCDNGVRYDNSITVCPIAPPPDHPLTTVLPSTVSESWSVSSGHVFSGTGLTH